MRASGMSGPPPHPLACSYIGQLVLQLLLTEVDDRNAGATELGLHGRDVIPLFLKPSL